MKTFSPLRIFIFFVPLFFFMICQGQDVESNQELKFITAIELPNVSGRIDHLAFDSIHQKVFIAALGNNTVEIVDLKTNRVIHTLKNLHEPQGILFIPEYQIVVVANGGNGECDIYNSETYQKLTSIKLDGDADNIRYDSTDKKIYVGYGNGSLGAIDANTFKLMTTINLSGHPESFQIDHSTHRIYVNVPDKQQIEVVDLKRQTVTERWNMTEATSNFPMSLDEANHRLFIGCRHPARLLTIDTQTGKTVSSVECDADTDDLFYNRLNKQVYMSCGAGYLNVFKQNDPSNYRRIVKVETRGGARTSLYIPQLNQLVVATPSRLGSNAQLMIYQIR